MKIRPVGAELFHVDRQTDRRTNGQTEKTKSVVVFRNFPNVSKNIIFISLVRVCFIKLQKCLMWFPLSFAYLF